MTLQSSVPHSSRTGSILEASPRSARQQALLSTAFTGGVKDKSGGGERTG